MLEASERRARLQCLSAIGLNLTSESVIRHCLDDWASPMPFGDRTEPHAISNYIGYVGYGTKSPMPFGDRTEPHRMNRYQQLCREADGLQCLSAIGLNLTAVGAQAYQFDRYKSPMPFGDRTEPHKRWRPPVWMTCAVSNAFRRSD